MRIKILRSIVLWLGLIVSISSVLAVAQDFGKLLAIASDPQSTEGEITSTDCGRHATSFYRYTVEGIVHDGSATRTSNCESLKAGERLQVFYATNKPYLNELTNPNAGLLNAIIFAAITSVFSATAISVLILLLSRPSSNQGDSS